MKANKKYFLEGEFEKQTILTLVEILNYDGL